VEPDDAGGDGEDAVLRANSGGEPTNVERGRVRGGGMGGHGSTVALGAPLRIGAFSPMRVRLTA
jgi:hypothetical protein